MKEENYRIVEYNEQGHPEVIEIKYKNEWFRYVHFSTEHEKQMNQFIKKNLEKK